MQKEKLNKEALYRLTFNNIGGERKYRVTKKNKLKILSHCSWLENDLKNQWIFKDYKCYYIVVSMYEKNVFTVTCSGYKLKKKYFDLEKAKIASFRFCDKIMK